MSINIKTHGYDVSRNTSGGRAKPKYIVMHYTATDRATAYNELMYFATNPSAVNASADFFVDDISIYQYNTRLDSRYSWAVGDGSGGSFGGKCNNSNQISIEMCCYLQGGKWYISNKTYTKAVELAKFLMKKYSIPAENVIRHYDVSRKPCPQAVGWIPATGEATWQKFKKEISGSTTASTSKPTTTTTTTSTLYRVRKSANDAKTQIGAWKNLDSAKAQADKNAGYSVFDQNGKLIYSPKAKKKSNTEIAREVIAGKWGNGADRKKRLTAAGYDYSTIQTEVNKLMR